MQLGLEYFLHLRNSDKVPPRIRFLLDRLPISVKSLVPFVKMESRGSLALFQIFYGIGLNKQIFNYGLKVPQRLCLENDKKKAEDDSELE